jgi:hypothetical protein
LEYRPKGDDAYGMGPWRIAEFESPAALGQFRCRWGHDFEVRAIQL